MNWVWITDEEERVDFGTLYQAVKAADGETMISTVSNSLAIEEVQDNVSIIDH